MHDNNLMLEIEGILKKVIAKEYIEEARIILLLTNDKNRSDFVKYYNEDKDNVCCLVLDFAKRELVEQKVLMQHEDDAFGKPLPEL